MNNKAMPPSGAGRLETTLAHVSNAVSPFWMCNCTTALGRKCCGAFTKQPFLLITVTCPAARFFAPGSRTSAGAPMAYRGNSLRSGWRAPVPVGLAGAKFVMVLPWTLGDVEISSAGKYEGKTKVCAKSVFPALRSKQRGAQSPCQTSQRTLFRCPMPKRSSVVPSFHEFFRRLVHSGRSRYFSAVQRREQARSRGLSCGSLNGNNRKTPSSRRFHYRNAWLSEFASRVRGRPIPRLSRLQLN